MKKQADIVVPDGMKTYGICGRRYVAGDTVPGADCQPSFAKKVEKKLALIAKGGVKGES